LCLFLRIVVLLCSKAIPQGGPLQSGRITSFCPELTESYKRAAALADRVLKGAPPSDLPGEEPSRFTLAINMKTAAELGLKVPGSILARADQVVE
jgi:putative ABC transport system substrate-binding protein